VPDAAGHALPQPIRARGLPPDDAPVVGVEETDQACPLAAGPLQHRFDRSVVHATWVARLAVPRTADNQHVPEQGIFLAMSSRQARDLRASDTDRDRVLALLSEAMSDGRLTAEEHAERVQRACSARTLGELAELTTDLAVPSA